MPGALPAARGFLFSFYARILNILHRQMQIGKVEIDQFCAFEECHEAP